MVGPGTQAFRQPRQRADLRLDVGGAAAAVARQVLRRPPFGGLAQPLLGDAGEGQPPGMTEDRQVPGVAGLLAGRIGQRPADMTRERVQQRPDRLAGDLAGVALLDRGDLLAAQRMAGYPQISVGDLGSAACPLPDPEQHLHDHQRRQPVQADLPIFGDGGLGPPPLPGVQARVGPGDGPPPLIVGVAVAASAVRGACARRDRARPERRQRPDPGIGQELPDRRLTRPLAELPDMRLTHDRPCHRGLTLAPGYRAPHHAGRQRRQLRRPGDLFRGQPLPGQPGEATMAHPAQPGTHSRGAPAGPAHRPAQQPVPGAAATAPGSPDPSPPPRGTPDPASGPAGRLCHRGQHRS